MTIPLTPEQKEILYAILNGRQIEGSCAGGSWNTINNPWELLTSAHWELRIKPKTIKIGTTEVPEPVRNQLKIEQEYWYFDLTTELLIKKSAWNNSILDNVFLKHGIIHLTKENAMIHAKALLDLMVSK